MASEPQAEPISRRILVAVELFLATVPVGILSIFLLGTLLGHFIRRGEWLGAAVPLLALLALFVLARVTFSYLERGAESLARRKPWEWWAIGFGCFVVAAGLSLLAWESLAAETLRPPGSLRFLAIYGILGVPALSLSLHMYLIATGVVRSNISLEQSRDT